PPPHPPPPMPMAGLHPPVHHLFHGELLDDLAELHLNIEPLLVPVDELLDRRRQVLVGRDHGHQLPDIERASEREIAPHRVEQEWCQLGEEIVEELDEELPLIKLEADVVDLRQPIADVGP